MKTKEIIQVAEAYGFHLRQTDPNGKMRFHNDERFIDVWNGKKGITVGVYNPETSRIKYYKKLGLKLEDILMKYSI